MKRRFILGTLAATLAAGPLTYAQESPASIRRTPLEEVSDENPYPIMRLDARQRAAWHMELEGLPETTYDIALHFRLKQAQEAGSRAQLSLLPYMNYTPSKWSQGSCGDCWIWGSTAAASIAAGVHQGTPAWFSVQYMNSSYTASNPCCGGTAGRFASWYNSKKFFVPWSNTNAGFADASRKCGYATNVAASSIATDPKVVLTRISASTVTTRGVGQATAIANIKNVLNQNKAITFSYMLPTGTAWSDFSSFWNGSSQDTPWTNVDKYSGLSWTSSGGGHLTCIVGYDDADRTWVVLNSWGARSNRPAGTFKIPQAMNYDAYYVDGGSASPMFYFNPMEITWPDPVNVVTANITSPASNITIPTGTSQAFAGTATDSSSTATLSYAWNFGDGGNAVGATASHTFTNSGSSPISYTVTLTATDNTGAKGTATRVVTVNPPAPNVVTASITTPSSDVILASGTSQSFVGTATDTDASATLTYRWNFGDGSTGIGANVSHTYVNSGTTPVKYPVTLTVTDQTGASGTATRNVTVNPLTNTDKIVNGGFESGATGWSGHTSSIGSSTSQSPHTGTKYAWLGGYGKASAESISQTVTIPAAGGILSFWLHVDTAETTSTTAYDTLKVQICNPAGTVLGYATYSNLNRSTGYVQHRLDLGGFKGQTVQIRFLSTEDSSLATSFVLDDISLK